MAGLEWMNALAACAAAAAAGGKNELPTSERRQAAARVMPLASWCAAHARTGPAEEEEGERGAQACQQRVACLPACRPADATGLRVRSSGTTTR